MIEHLSLEESTLVGLPDQIYYGKHSEGLIARKENNRSSSSRHRMRIVSGGVTEVPASVEDVKL